MGVRASARASHAERRLPLMGPEYQESRHVEPQGEGDRTTLPLAEEVVDALQSFLQH